MSDPSVFYKVQAHCNVQNHFPNSTCIYIRLLDKITCRIHKVHVYWIRFLSYQYACTLLKHACTIIFKCVYFNYQCVYFIKYTHISSSTRILYLYYACTSCMYIIEYTHISSSKSKLNVINKVHACFYKVHAYWTDQIHF